MQHLHGTAEPTIPASPHRFRQQQHYQNKSHPDKHKPATNTATSDCYTSTALPPATLLLPAATPKRVTIAKHTQTHFPQTTLLPASLRSVLLSAQHYCYQQHHPNKPHPHKHIFHKQHCHQHQSHQHCHQRASYLQTLSFPQATQLLFARLQDSLVNY